jgi:hypothetical protein
MLHTCARLGYAAIENGTATPVGENANKAKLIGKH